MATSKHLYSSLKSLSSKCDILKAKFTSFRAHAHLLADPRNGIQGLEVEDSTQDTSFLIQFCDHTVRFSFTAQMSDTGQPLGVVSCALELQDGAALNRKAVAQFSYAHNGIVNVAKPDDFDDQLSIDDNVSAVYLIAHHLALALEWPEA